MCRQIRQWMLGVHSDDARADVHFQKEHKVSFGVELNCRLMIFPSQLQLHLRIDRNLFQETFERNLRRFTRVGSFSSGETKAHPK